MATTALTADAPLAATASPAESSGDASVAELMARVAAGDAEAFAPIVERYERRLFGYFMTLVNDPSSAADLAQETFVRAYRAAGRYRESGRFEAWLFRIAANLVRSDRRRASRRGLHLSLDDAPAGSGDGLALVAGAATAPRAAEPSPDESTWRAEIREALEQALPRVPFLFRQAVLLRDLEGWSYREIAEMLEIEEGTAKSRAHRGRMRLRALLAPAFESASFEPTS